MPSPALTPSPDVAAYPALFRRVKEALLEGRRRIEAEKVRTVHSRLMAAAINSGKGTCTFTNTITGKKYVSL